MKKLLIIPMVCGLAACSTPKHLTDPIAAQESIKCKTDAFTQVTTCDMPTIWTDINGKDETALSWMQPISYSYFRVVSGSFKDTNLNVISLNGRVNSKDWLFIESVRDSDGNSLKMEKIDSDVDCRGGCTTKEYFVIDMDRNYISKHRQNGISLKFYSKRGNAIINLPPSYVQGFDNYLKSKGI